MSHRRHNPDKCYTAHEHALDSPSLADRLLEANPELRDRRDNRYDNQRTSRGVPGPIWDPDEEIDLDIDKAPGLGSGVGLACGPSGRVTLEEIKRRARKQRADGQYPPELQDKIAEVKQEIADGTDPESLDPIDLT